VANAKVADIPKILGIAAALNSGTLVAG